jgi:hypothetical protein
MTYRLWYALNHPPATHPLFRSRVLLPGERRSYTWAGLVSSFIQGTGQQSPTLLLVMMPLILVCVGVVYGLDCAMRVGTAIAYERENERFILLSLSPPGPLGSAWAICATALYRNHDFIRLRSVVRVTLALAFIGALIVLLLANLFTIATASHAYGQEVRFSPLSSLVAVLAAFLAVYMEYTGSAVLGTLVGILVPTFTRARLDTLLLSFGVFLLLQIAVYLMTFFLGFWLLPVFRLNFDETTESIVLTLIRLLIFYAAREAVIAAVWLLVVRRTNAAPSELDFVTAA